MVSVNFTVSPFLYWVDVHTAQRSRQCLSSIQQTQLSKMKFCEDWRGAFPTSPAEVCYITSELCFRMHDIDLFAWDNYLMGIGIFRNLKKIVSWLYKILKIFHWMLPLKGSPTLGSMPPESEHLREHIYAVSTKVICSGKRLVFVLLFSSLWLL